MAQLSVWMKYFQNFEVVVSLLPVKRETDAGVSEPLGGDKSDTSNKQVAVVSEYTAWSTV